MVILYDWITFHNFRWNAIAIVIIYAGYCSGIIFFAWIRQLLRTCHCHTLLGYSARR